MQVIQYEAHMKKKWDNFVATSANGTFLFYRDYMEYHQDRFQDHSLLIFDDDSNLLAVLPANRHGEKFQSHGGLTYGGFVFQPTLTTPPLLEVFDLTLTHLQKKGFTQFLYKTIPSIYATTPGQADHLALFLSQASIARTSLISVVDNATRLAYQSRRKRGKKKAQKSGLYIIESDDLTNYWVILSNVLTTYHDTKPVHTLAEISKLKTLFPYSIRLFAAIKENEMLAGTLIYETEQVARTQYIASSKIGRKLGAMDLLFITLLDEIYDNKRYIEFGTSDELGGLLLNRGLIEQKEGFGARPIAHTQFTLDLSTWIPGTILEALT